MVGVEESTVRRWRQQVAFRNLIQQLLREHVDSVQLRMVALTGEAVNHVHGLICSFDDSTSLRAIGLVLSKAVPIIGVIGAELRRSPAATGDPAL